MLSVASAAIPEATASSKFRQSHIGKLGKMRLTLKTINDELKRLGEDTRLEKGDGYFYFRGGTAANWLDTTVRVATLSSLALEQWVDEFNRLKKLNQDILRGPDGSNSATPKATRARPKKR